VDAAQALSRMMKMSIYERSSLSSCGGQSSKCVSRLAGDLSLDIPPPTCGGHIV
jgi:hypothetical protein